TLMNALLALVSPDQRVVTIEETPELRPHCPHVVSLVARGPNVEGKGSIGLAELFRASLRMRPDRIVVGEVRGPEALIALDAMSTGHAGSMVTVHARSAAETVDRMVTLALDAGTASEASLARRFVQAFDLVVFLERRDGRRVASEIASP
ncbi:MAG: CpaF/VirB11 family protein, partial [Actinomycetota bacterium]|nr:CpaF/VirB11 family protein [Actinomycetota bacterium]